MLGVDDLNSYYDPALKRARLERLQAQSGFTFAQADIADLAAITALARRHRERIDGVVHLAAQAGVRHSLKAPFDYVRSNLAGPHGDARGLPARAARARHLVYASSSSVYGGNSKIPFAVEDRVDQPISLYAATKRADELLSHCYSHLYRIPATGLRFFTVYGPWGRPDMAAYLFADAITAGRPITLYNQGDMERDFTYIDDVVAGVLAALDRPPAADGDAPHALYNLGNHRPVAAPPLRRGARAGARHEGRDPPRPAAARRRGPHLRRHRGQPPRSRLRAQDPDRGGPARASSPGTASTTASERERGRTQP